MGLLTDLLIARTTPPGRARPHDPLPEPAPAEGRRPRTLVLANRLPFPVDDGWKTRTFHVIRGLARHADVTVLSFHDGNDAVVEGFRSAVGAPLEVVTVPSPGGHSPIRLLLGLLTPTPVYVWNMRSRRFRQEFTRLVEAGKPDTVVAELTYLYPYLRDLPAPVRRVIDTHNIDSVVLERYSRTLPGRLRRLYAGLTARKLRKYESHVFADADRVWVCSEQEERLARQIAPGAAVATIPNGVDTDVFAPVPDVDPDPRRLLFFGRMDYEPNRDAIQFFADDILPALRSRDPQIELHVVGGGIGSELRRLARRNPEIRLVGRVDDLRPVVAAAGIVVVPLRMGGGTRLKILEALSLAKPVVSTTVGAEGLAVVPEEDLLIADTGAHFAEQIHRLTSDPKLRQCLGERGRETARARYDWSSIQRSAASTLGWL